MEIAGDRRRQALTEHLAAIDRDQFLAAVVARNATVTLPTRLQGGRGMDRAGSEKNLWVFMDAACLY